MWSRAQIARSSARQSGMSLFPALMFLLVLSVLGVSALNSTLMQEKMVANTKDVTPGPDHGADQYFSEPKGPNCLGKG